MIIYFSGTGNTRYCANKLAERLGDETLEISGGMILSPSLTHVDTTDRRIIWMTPVYSWGIPPVVESFMRRAIINAPRHTLHHLVLTCGDDAGLTETQWRRIMKERRLDCGGAFSVIMPNTYVLMKGFNVDPAAVEERKIKDAGPRLDEIAAVLRPISVINEEASKLKPSASLPFDAKKTKGVKRGHFAWFKSKIIYPWFVRNKMSPAAFHATEDCNGCGLCSHNCPLGNITFIGHSTPHWSKNCALCLRCYHICPNHAVAYGKKTENKGQYNRMLTK